MFREVLEAIDGADSHPHVSLAILLVECRHGHIRLRVDRRRILPCDDSILLHGNAVILEEVTEDSLEVDDDHRPVH